MGMGLVLAGFLALTLIVVSPSLADAQVLDEGGTAALENSPVTPVKPDSDGKAAGVSASSGGGVGVPGMPMIRRVNCLTKCAGSNRATRGAIIGIRGDNLNRVTKVVFRSKNGHIKTRWRKRSRAVVRVTVPKRAVQGRIFVVDASGNRSNRPTLKLAVDPVKPGPDEVFPVRGPISFGSSGSRFGAGRTGHTHQGQDVSASCGTKLVSVKRARVLYNTWDDGGGNYVVLHNIGTRTNFVYMHMLRRSPLRVGQVIRAGAPVGRVGNTGRSYGCHLHFEYWQGPWQTGGYPIDPLPFLRSLLKK